MIKAALFDLDGVIIDTESQYTIFWDSAGARFIPDIPDFALRVKGQTLTYIFDTYFPSTVIQEELKRLINEFEQQMVFDYVPGVEALLHELKEKGIPTAVVTSSNHAKMEHLYRVRPELPFLFTTVRTAEDTARSKPAPDCYLAAAKALDAEPSECLVFEDSLNGLRAGRDSGATVVGLTTSLSREEIAPLCHYIIKDFLEHTAEDFLAL